MWRRGARSTSRPWLPSAPLATEGRQAQMHNNLALENAHMGLYALAREDAAEAVATARRTGARTDLAYYLDTLARAYMALGEAAHSEALNTGRAHFVTRGGGPGR